MPSLSILSPAGPVAAEVAQLWNVLLVGGIAILALVMGLLAYVLLRAPQRRPRIRETRMIVLGGLVLPTVTLAALLIYGIRLTGTVAAEDDAPQRVRVVAHQWWWEVHHDRAGANAVVLRDELRLPAGRPVEVLVTSADVIHSFWVPQLAGKIDAIPGRWNRLRLQADRPGELRGQCSEFCGQRHAHMALRVLVASPDDFAGWLDAQP